MRPEPNLLTHCFVDESIHKSFGYVVTAFVFASGSLEESVTDTLRKAGLNPPHDEFKSSARMDTDPQMRAARDGLLSLAGRCTRIAVFFGPFSRQHLGRQVLQALQSVVVRNGICPSRLTVHFDEQIFLSSQEASRLHQLFHALRGCVLFPQEDSRIRVGIQVADAVASSFGRILKESLTRAKKMVDVGGAETGYAEGTEAPLGWVLLMSLRYALLTRQVIYNGEPYAAGSDPVVIDPERDDPVTFGQHPVLLGWGVQVAPEAEAVLRRAIEDEFGRLWLGCTH